MRWFLTSTLMQLVQLLIRNRIHTRIIPQHHWDIPQILFDGQTDSQTHRRAVLFVCGLKISQNSKSQRECFRSLWGTQYTYQPHCRSRYVWLPGIWGGAATNIQLLNLYKSESAQHNNDTCKLYRSSSWGGRQTSYSAIDANHTSNWATQGFCRQPLSVMRNRADGVARDIVFLLHDMSCVSRSAHTNVDACCVRQTSATWSCDKSVQSAFIAN